MTKFFFALAILMSGLPALSQNSDNARVSGSLYINPARTKDKPKGSPYGQLAFARARVPNINVEAYMRYNIYADEFEFITPKNDTLILDKIADFGNINFVEGNRKYVLVAYTDDKKLVYGYLLNQYENNGCALLKKENMGYTEAKVAKTSLERDMPARYAKLSDTYFFKNKDNGIVEFPKSKKALVKLFPDKKQVIEDFLENNKIDFNAEADLIKVVNFLAK